MIAKTARTALLILMAACLLPLPAIAQPSDETALEFLQTLRQEEGIPGMSAAVVREGEVIWTGQSGLASIELEAPVTVDTKFRLGSVSKTVTATLAVRMAQAGIVDLDLPVGTYRPSLPEDKQALTLRQLLGHLGGIRHYNGADFNPLAPGGNIDSRIYPDRDAELAIFIDDPLIAEPGEKYQYTTFGFTLIGAVLESAGEKPFWELVDDYILQPLDLNGISEDVLWQILPGRTEHYDPGQRYRVVYPQHGDMVRAGPVNAAYKTEGGGMMADAVSLALFGYAMAEPGFLDPAFFAETFTSQQDAAGEETGVGLGWRIGEDAAGRTIYHHAGSMQGARALVLVYPAEGLSIAMFSNLGGTPGDILSPGMELGSLFLD